MADRSESEHSEVEQRYRIRRLISGVVLLETVLRPYPSNIFIWHDELDSLMTKVTWILFYKSGSNADDKAWSSNDEGQIPKYYLAEAANLNMNGSGVTGLKDYWYQ
jgi:hypothetical protein